MNNDTVGTGPGGANPVHIVNNLMPRRNLMSLKQRINNMLWEELRGDVTIDQADGLACDIMLKMLDYLPEEEDNGH